MLTLRDGCKVFVNLSPTDMRKSIDGLCVLVLEQFKEPPQSGHLFVFCNETRNRIKVLYWDRNGFVLHYKRLDRGRFRLKRNELGILEITEHQLQWLLAGLEFQLMQKFNELNYTNYY